MVGFGSPDIYQTAGLVHSVCTGPGGLSIACLSSDYDGPNRIETISIFAVTTGLVCAGRLVLGHTCSDFEHSTLNKRSRVVWHPSGEKLLAVQGGVVYFVRLKWSFRGDDRETTYEEALRGDERSNGDSFVDQMVNVSLECYKKLDLLASTACTMAGGRDVLLGLAGGKCCRLNWRGHLLEEHDLSPEYTLWRLANPQSFTINHLVKRELQVSDMMRRTDEERQQLLLNPSHVPSSVQWAEYVRIGAAVMADGSVIFMQAEHGGLSATSRILPVLLPATAGTSSTHRPPNGEGGGDDEANGYHGSDDDDGQNADDEPRGVSETVSKVIDLSILDHMAAGSRVLVAMTVATRHMLPSGGNAPDQILEDASVMLAWVQRHTASASAETSSLQVNCCFCRPIDAVPFPQQSLRPLAPVSPVLAVNGGGDSDGEAVGVQEEEAEGGVCAALSADVSRMMLLLHSGEPCIVLLEGSSELTLRSVSDPSSVMSRVTLEDGAWMGMRSIYGGIVGTAFEPESRRTRFYVLPTLVDLAGALSPHSRSTFLDPKCGSLHVCRPVAGLSEDDSIAAQCPVPLHPTLRRDMQASWLRVARGASTGEAASRAPYLLVATAQTSGLPESFHQERYLACVTPLTPSAGSACIVWILSQSTGRWRRSTLGPVVSSSGPKGAPQGLSGLAWYGDHTLVSLSLRQSTYCLDVFSRDVDPSSAALGSATPMAQMCVPLPPGYAPCHFDVGPVPTLSLPLVVRKTLTAAARNVGGEGQSEEDADSVMLMKNSVCVLVSDGRSITAYVVTCVCHKANPGESTEASVKGDSCGPTHYVVASLWDMDLTDAAGTGQVQLPLRSLRLVSPMGDSTPTTVACLDAVGHAFALHTSIPTMDPQLNVLSPGLSRVESIMEGVIALTVMESLPDAVDGKDAVSPKLWLAPSPDPLLVGGLDGLDGFKGGARTSSASPARTHTRCVLGCVVLLASRGRKGSGLWLPGLKTAPLLPAPPLGTGESILSCSTGVFVALRNRFLTCGLSRAAGVDRSGVTPWSLRRQSSALWLVEGLLGLCARQDSKLPTNVSALLKALLADARRQPSVCALLAHELELKLKAMTERSSTFECKKDFILTTSTLFACDDMLTMQVLSRLGRKLEPAVSQRMFPLPNVGHVGSEGGRSAASGSPWTQLALFELCLDMSLFEHATLMLTLACEEVGGADSRESTIESLIMSFELLYQSMRRLSLRVAVDTLQFVCRLESLLSCLFDARGVAWSYTHRNPLPMREFAWACAPERAQAGAMALPSSSSSSSPALSTALTTEAPAAPMGMGIYQQALSVISASPGLPIYMASSLVWSVARAVGALESLRSGGGGSGSSGDGPQGQRNRDYTSDYKWAVFDYLQEALGTSTLDDLFLKRSLSVQLVSVVLSDLMRRGCFFNTATLALVLLGSPAGHSMLERAFYSGFHMGTARDALAARARATAAAAAAAVATEEGKEEEGVESGASSSHHDTGTDTERESAGRLVTDALKTLHLDQLTDAQFSRRLHTRPQASFWMSHCEKEMHSAPGGREGCLEAFRLGEEASTSAAAAAAAAQCFITLPPPMAEGRLSYSSVLGGLAVAFLLVGRGDCTAVILHLLGMPELAVALAQGDGSPTAPHVTAIVDALVALASGDLLARARTQPPPDERTRPTEENSEDSPPVRLERLACEVCEALLGPLAATL